MKAITVRQPWAWAIMHGGKGVENRTRNIAGSYRGPIVIHAAKTYDDWAAAELIESVTGELIPPFDCGHASETLGAALGLVNLWASHPATPGGFCCPNDFRHYKAWAMSDQWHLCLTNPHPFPEPIPYRGALGLWEFPDDLLPEA